MMASKAIGNAAFATDPPDWISALAFKPRKQSWVAASSGHFYKIIRKGDDPLQDWMDSECIATARREYADTLFLSELSDSVSRPLRMEHGCIVYPLLSGPDMRALLRSRAGREQREASLRNAMALLAQLHVRGGEATGHPPLDYRRNRYLSPGEEIASRIAQRRKTLVIGGFEVRNLRFDRTRRQWNFFDPHHLWRGAPEEDFARFVVSLLMINWGRDGDLRIWTDFDMHDLLATYEHGTPNSLDRMTLDYFLREKLAMRKFLALKTLRTMSPALRLLGWPYLAMYFRQLETWSSTHAL